MHFTVRHPDLLFFKGVNSRPRPAWCDTLTLECRNTCANDFNQPLTHRLIFYVTRCRLATLMCRLQHVAVVPSICRSFMRAGLLYVFDHAI
jgi:hypothetical protein